MRYFLSTIIIYVLIRFSLPVQLRTFIHLIQILMFFLFKCHVILSTDDYVGERRQATSSVSSDVNTDLEARDKQDALQLEVNSNHFFCFVRFCFNCSCEALMFYSDNKNE